MLFPEQATAGVVARYWRQWRDWLDLLPPLPLSVPLNPPTAGMITRHQTEVREWLTNWAKWQQVHPNTRLRTASRRVPYGTETVYTHLDFLDVADAVELDSSAALHWERATRRYPLIVAHNPDREKVRPQLARIMDLDDDDFQLLLAVAAWFAANPRSGLTIRQVPVEGLHTKWLARHRRLVTALLTVPDMLDADASVPEDELAPAELDLLGLKPLPAQIDIILADPRDRARLHGLHHLRAPVEEIVRLPLTPRNVLIVENKESAMPIEDMSGLVVLHSLGNALNPLELIGWIPQERVWYWGDLDRAGLTLLSRARTRLPQLRSILMDASTLNAHLRLANADSTKADPPDATLTEDETRALGTLTATAPALRLEQERIPWQHVRAALTQALA